MFTAHLYSVCTLAYTKFLPSLQSLRPPTGKWTPAETRDHTGVKTLLCSVAPRKWEQTAGARARGKDNRNILFHLFPFSELIEKRTRQKGKFWIVKNGPFGMSTGQWWGSSAWFSGEFSIILIFLYSSLQRKNSLVIKNVIFKKTVRLCKIGFAIYS